MLRRGQNIYARHRCAVYAAGAVRIDLSSGVHRLLAGSESKMGEARRAVPDAGVHPVVGIEIDDPSRPGVLGARFPLVWRWSNSDRAARTGVAEGLEGRSDR